MKPTIITLIIVSFVYTLINCNQTREGDIGKGKRLFADRCIVCHNYKGESVSKMSLNEMSGLDSASLFNKLKAIKSDSTHKNHLNDIDFSSIEIQSLIIYIKDYSKPHA